MKPEIIVITFWETENADNLRDVLGEFEDLSSVDNRYQSGPISIHVAVEKKDLDKCLTWIKEHRLTVHRIETSGDYISLKYAEKKGNFLNEVKI